MKITILTYGSRGDVQPFISLSLGLMARGHSVKLAAPFRFKNLVDEHGIHFVPLAGEPEDLSRRLNDAGNNPIRMAREMMDHAIKIGADILRQVEESCQDADLIIHTFLHAVGAHTFAREKHIPDIHIQTFPMFTSTGDYPNVTLPDLKIPLLNYLTHVVSQKITWWGSKAGLERIRRRVRLPKRRLYWPFDEDPAHPRTPILCAWSPSILPPSMDWPPRVHVTGWFFLNSKQYYSPPPDLQTYLGAGEPPICVSFGSMVNRNIAEIDRIVGDSLRQTGSRGIILSGWSRVGRRSSDKILYMDSVPHDWLLPQCRLIIHHGGAGTTSAGLRAGIPSIVVPFTADQPFWGRRVHAMGAGPKPFPLKKLSVEKLTQAILQAETDAYRERAEVIGRTIRSEGGTEAAVGLIEKYSNEFHTH